ncbi:SMI1/KNR4 family protein [Thermomonospora cellulosilytica]|uniref:Cell wall assembly regulator SMI1 n=1 Tax=Thermomonospora cellulosilytica TaxID=1411118 RepID=A0A7W3N0U0_9ACTN|nr:SMI1/KNR4 family protein [Thermomonospora cellulosilytica]MBA9005442.1 cell wall assembly regulator SMI1 [Thermomonospora cellulosilytica]
MQEERKSRLAELFGPMAAAVVRAAPKGWTGATLRAHATPFRGAATVVYQGPGGRERHRVRNLDDELAALVQVAKGPGAGLDVTLAVRPSGNYEAVVTPRSKRGNTSHACIFDPGFEAPEVGEFQDGPRDPSEAGDPEEAVRLMEEYRRRYAAVLGRTPAEPSPVPSGLLDEMEAEIGVRLPADLRALYERLGHDPGGFYWEWLHPELRDQYRDVIGERHGGGEPTVLDADPPDTVRRVTGHPHWIPFGDDGSGNYLAVDMAPAPAGRPGQVIAAGNDYQEGPGYVADSVTSLLRLQLRWLEEEAYDAEPDRLDEDGAVLEEGYLDYDGDHWHQKPQQARRAVLENVDGAVRAEPQVQDLTVTGEGRLGLSPLSRTPLLKSLRLTCGQADLTPLAGLLVEDLSVAMTAADLTPLTGHPSLRRLTVSTREPVDIACLTTLPRLYSLDLSKAVVTSLEPLADMPGLRVLHLSYEQWQELWTNVDGHPSLAYATTTGDLSSAETLEWAADFPSLPAPPLLRHSGTVAPV